MSYFKRILLQEHFLVFVFSLALIAGPAISILFGNDLAQFPDCDTYMGLAQFDFDQNVIRRYRVLIPFLAAALDLLFGGLFSKLSPGYFSGNFSLAFSFFLVNSVLMACFGLLVYRFCKAYLVSRQAALLGVLVVLSSRYTIYFAALPLVDSLFCVTVTMALLGIKEKNNSLLLWSIFLGPFAKEAFIFIAPIIFFFSHIPKLRLLFYFGLSGILIFSFHFLYDVAFPPSKLNWLKADVSHVYNIKYFIKMLFSFYGLYKILINIGLWLLPLCLPLFWPELRRSLKGKLEMYIPFFMFSVLLQMLLSGSMERMFYLAMPIVALLVALIYENVKKHIRFSSKASVH